MAGQKEQHLVCLSMSVKSGGSQGPVYLWQVFPLWADKSRAGEVLGHRWVEKESWGSQVCCLETHTQTHTNSLCYQALRTKHTYIRTLTNYVTDPIYPMYITRHVIVFWGLEFLLCNIDISCSMKGFTTVHVSKPPQECKPTSTIINMTPSPQTALP